MKKPLLEVIFASEKRKEVLLLLQDRAREMEYLLSSLSTTRTALLPQIRILEKHHLVSHDRDTYELTTIGKLIVDKMLPLLNSVSTFDIDIDYWGTHKLDFIPSYLLKRINEVSKCRIVDPNITELFSSYSNYHESCNISKYVYGVTTFFHPHFYDVFARQIENNVNTHMILSSELFENLKTNHYSAFKTLINSELVHFFLYSKRMEFLTFSFNDYNLLISPLKNTGEADHRYVLCCTPDALEWGKELYEYFLKDSIPITEI